MLGLGEIAILLAVLLALVLFLAILAVLAVAASGVALLGGGGLALALKSLAEAFSAALARRARAWTTAAEQLGLSRVTSFFGGDRLTGEVDGLPVVVAPEQRSQHHHVTVCRVGGVPAAVRVGRWSLLVPGHDTGDPVFDRSLRMLAAPRETLAHLDVPARRALLAASQGEVWVTGGEVCVGIGGSPSAERLVALVRQAVEVARTLRDGPPTVPGRLARMAREDPAPAVRHRALTALSELDREAAVAVAEGAVLDPDPALRVLAAGLAQRWDVLAAMAGDPGVAPDLRVRALGAIDPSDRASLAAAVALGVTSPEAGLRLAAVELAGREKLVASLPVLAGLLRGPLSDLGGHDWEAEQPLALALARALDAIASPQAEPVLLDLLDAPSNEIRVVVLRALGEVGTVTAVERILPHTKSPWGPVGAAARQAIAGIHGRLDGAAAGQLSLAVDAVGAVSLAEPPLPREPVANDPALPDPEAEPDLT